MKAGTMTQAVAKAIRADIASVKVTVRTLVKAGYLTSGARGVNAPDMTALDAARVLATQLAREVPGYSAAAILEPLEAKECRMNPGGGSEPFSLEQLSGLEFPASFTDVLAALIQTFAFEQESAAFKAVKDPSCEVGIQAGDTLSWWISMGPKGDTRTAMYSHTPFGRVGDQGQNLPPAPETLRTIKTENIRVVADALAGRA